MSLLRLDHIFARPWARRRSDGAAAFRRTSVCLLCHSGGPPEVLPDSVCATCGSPLAAPPATDARAIELLGRRGALRSERDHVATVHQGWPSAPMSVRWRDLSLTGLCVLAEVPIPVGRVIRVSDRGVDVVAQVVDCRSAGRFHSVHGKLLRARFVQTSGVFLSARV